MSRDWAPFEHYLNEQRQVKEGYGDIFSFMERLKIKYNNGKEEIVHSPEEMAVRRQFPMLGKLLMDHFMELHERLSLIPGGIEFLHHKDNELADLVKSIESKSNNIDEDTYLFKWFVGNLDEHFYYSERNNELFLECMLDDAMVFCREDYDAQKFEAALQYFSRDIDVAENRDFLKGHANKLIYCFENKKDMLDFDFWVRYELLLGEKITWEEYVAVDNTLDGDPHDVELSHKRTINTFKEKLKECREGAKGKASLDANIEAAESVKSESALSSESKRDDKER